MLGKAIAIAAKAFENKKDKGGHPYILHCLHVMNAVTDLGEFGMTVAVLHDLLEDCPEWSKERLSQEGFDLQTIQFILNLTKAKDEEYMSYIGRVAMNEVSRRIKMADLEHNSQIMRMKGLTNKDFDRLQKYFTAYEYLKS